MFTLLNTTVTPAIAGVHAYIIPIALHMHAAVI